MSSILDRPAHEIVQPHKVIASRLTLRTTSVDPKRIPLARRRKLDIRRHPLLRITRALRPPLSHVLIVVVPAHAQIRNIPVVRVGALGQERDFVVLVEVVFVAAAEGHALAALDVLVGEELLVVVELVGLHDLFVWRAEVDLVPVVPGVNRLVPWACAGAELEVAVGDGHATRLCGDGLGCDGYVGG
ncbi:hypothetical protein HG530_013284 [Fusarium avenaceum]|nr:hypothetical protein HG530_013284 [Fusarium avenaceum]